MREPAVKEYRGLRTEGLEDSGFGQSESKGAEIELGMVCARERKVGSEQA